MTEYNTGNPIPSSDVRDLLDNATIEDNFVNGPLDFYADRLGVSRQSLQGIRNASQYQILGPYGAGLQFTGYNQVFSYLGEFYAPGAGLVLPYTTDGTGAPEIANFRSVGDAVLRSDLSSDTDPSLGSGIPRFSWEVPYAENTAGGAVQIFRNIRSFGALANDGVTNDLAVFQAAAAAGPGIIDARGVTCLIDGQVNIGSGQIWLLAGADLKQTSTTATMLAAITVNDWSIVGPFRITGPGSTVGTATGILIEDCARWRLESPDVLSIQGHGIRCEGGAGITSRADHGFITNPRIRDCYKGYEDFPGSISGTEYLSIINPMVTGCTLWGMRTVAGNVRIVNPQIVDNAQDGLIVGAGSNHAHGGVVGGNINHNARYNLYTEQVTNGMTFVGTHFYGGAAGAGAIFLDRSKGINISNGHLDCWVYNDKDGSSGQNIIRDMYCPGGYGAVILATGPNPGADQLWFQDCYGPGSLNTQPINDPSPVYVLARRLAAATQVVGSATTLVWPTERYDRRLAYDNATGVFTVPPGQDGNYLIRGHVVISGASLSSTASYLELLVGGGAIGLFSPAIFSSTKLTFSFDWNLDLSAGNTLKLNATVSGTSPVFGDSTYESWLSIERIA